LGKQKIKTKEKKVPKYRRKRESVKEECGEMEYEKKNDER